jgi:ectoine hydroxylase-related dioxygenase (phytanoyl-CoA dioxygenase family)
LNPAALQSAFSEQGYVVLEDFYSAAEVADADKLISECEHKWSELPGEMPEGPGVEIGEYRRRFGVYLKALPISRTPAFRGLYSDPRMQQITRQIIGDDFTNLVGFTFASPRDGGQGWHKDSVVATPGQFTLNRLLYTRDYSPAQGKLYILPGSHHYEGFTSDGPNQEDLPDQVEITPKAGMLVLVSSQCAHRVGINQTDDIRVVLNSRVNPAGVSAELCDLCAFRSGRWRHSTKMFLGKSW